MNVWIRGRCGVLDRVPRRVDVGHVGARKAGDHRAFDRAGDLLHGLEVARRGDREARPRSRRRRAARAAGRSPASPACSARCRATARRRAASCRRSVLGLGPLAVSCHSSIVSNLASSRCWSRGYMRPPTRYSPRRGEEKKSKVEAECHAEETVANPLRHHEAVRRLALIVNPVAGGGRPARALPPVQAELRARGADQRFEYTKSLEHARRARARGGGRRGEIAVAFGGDGLIGAVAGALQALGRRRRRCSRAAAATTSRGCWGSRSSRSPRVRVLAAGGRADARSRARSTAGRSSGIASCGFDSEANRIANETTRRARQPGLRLRRAAGARRAGGRRVRGHARRRRARAFTGYTVAAANSRPTAAGC